LDIERVWLDYDSSDPDYQPKRADFEVWPGNPLFIDESEEPDSGDVLSIYYTRDQTISGLDAETTTTVDDRDINTLVNGAAGYCVKERIQEEEHWWGKRDMKEWGARRLREFEDALDRIAHRQATKHSGVAPASNLDRYDGDWV
jgi:hypothetical protein